MARPNPQNNVLNAYKQRQAQFLHSLAVCHNGRGAPLPPALTGVPYPPNYDPHNSPWKALQLTGDVGVFRLAGRDIELFKLWNTVLSAGGGAKVGRNLISPFSHHPHFLLPGLPTRPLGHRLRTIRITRLHSPPEWSPDRRRLARSVLPRHCPPV